MSLVRVSFKYCTEVFSVVKTGADIFLFKKKCGVIVELKYAQNEHDSRNTAIGALKQIFNSKYDTVLNSTSYFPEGAKEYILLGFSINAETKDISMCCLRRQKDGNAPTKEDIEEAIHV